ncbi:MAG: nucleotidyltransferase family protein [Terriglobia bacterium]
MNSTIATPVDWIELRLRLRPFCEKHRIRRLDVFGSAALGQATAASDVDMMATLDETVPVSTGELLEMAGEAEVSRPTGRLPAAFVVGKVAEPCCPGTYSLHSDLCVWRLTNSDAGATFFKLPG